MSTAWYYLTVTTGRISILTTLRVVAQNVYSSPHEITLSLRWIALLYNKIHTEIVAATGIHDYKGVIKQLLAGATSVQICSTLYLNGVNYIGTILKELENWMKQKGYDTLPLSGVWLPKMKKTPAAFERVQFMKKTAGKF